VNEVVVLSNRRLDETGGRPDKLRVRKAMLEERGWETTLVAIESTIPGILGGIVRTLRILYRSDAGVYLSMSNPPHLHIVGLFVSLFTATPWLAEIRDPLVTIPGVDETSLSGRIRGLLESAMVSRAHQVVWLDGIQMADDYFEETYGERTDPNWYKLPFIGYRNEKFDQVEAAEFDRFTIAYAGSFYEGWIEPYAFLDGFARFVNERDLDPDDVQFLVYGDWNETYTEAVEERDLSTCVTTHGFVPHEELLPVLAGADVMLYIGGNDTKNRLSVPSKIWDYVGVKRPILVVADPDFRSGEFVMQEDIGVVADPDDPDDVAEKLGILYDGEFVYDADGNERFRRDRNVEELVDVLKTMREGKTKHGRWHDE
jgi:glycosyltransferase involved in cell wall biosynthesis